MQVVLQEPLQVCIGPHRVSLEMLEMVAVSLKAILLVVLIGVCIGAGTKSRKRRAEVKCSHAKATGYNSYACSMQ